ncbi:MULTISPECIES: hypothetical protein [Flavobacterium]|jgi:hypothetical protein|uniref:Uncharacterized protein n=1 Tax=Flavobacterium pectinovorum TaxID=29533 RepID=A0AB36P0E9_9FLAO|nr:MULTISPECIES: hypothetical protein [Flavobacterium]KIQ22125.1 hypothetical protein RT99_07965 [Flavobacterium sp. MEB061]OXB04781.1 hypothetical protein B0A72_09875 [Flavobacterium pectinovorum]SHL41373.1 hypothetical protein SAMN05444387_0545 [Flavobacterium pectinovorum]
MNWIRKTIIFVSLLIITLFAFQANEAGVPKIENKKTNPAFSVENVDTSEFIQPQASYHFAANIKTSQSVLIKWFETLLMTIPGHQVVKSTTNFANQFSNQSKKISLLLYPFHYFW